MRRQETGLPLCEFMPARIRCAEAKYGTQISGTRRTRPARPWGEDASPGRLNPAVGPAVIGGEGRADWNNSVAQHSSGRLLSTALECGATFLPGHVFSGVCWQGERDGREGAWMVWREGLPAQKSPLITKKRWKQVVCARTKSDYILFGPDSRLRASELALRGNLSIGN